jgi:hypothetical protein
MRMPVDPGGSIVESEAAEVTPASDAEKSADISHKTFRFNPPMHSANLSVRPDMGNVGQTASQFYDEKTAPSGYTDKWAKEGLGTLRLGRIIQHSVVPGPAGQMSRRWGFRFLYNPTTISTAASRNDSFVIDPRSETNQVVSGVSQNFQTVSFTVLLDRLPDIASGIPNGGKNQYSPSLSKSDRDGILRYGTHWDLEALFKVCNGDWNLTDRGKTANIGVLMPSNARLILGSGVNFYGFVMGVTWKDEMFLGNMIPVRTRADITFRRHVDMTIDQAKAAFPGMVSDATDSPADPNSGSGDSSVGNNRDAPVPGHNRVTTGFYGYSGHNGWDYAVPTGTSVHATHGGVVERIRYLTNSYGKHVFVRYGNVQMIYAHLSAINSGLREGASINSGDYIGKSGSTGRSTGPHLHYEERVSGTSRIPQFANNTGRVR